MTDRRWYEFSWFDVVFVAGWTTLGFWLVGPPRSWWEWPFVAVGILAGRGLYALLRRERT